MFRIVSERLAWWPVHFGGVTEAGAVVEHKIELRFRILDEDAIVEFHGDLAAVNEAARAGTTPATSAVIAPVLLPIIADWRGVGAENGEPLPFSAEAFQQLLKVPNVGPAIGGAYAACRAAVPELREGN